MIYIALSGKSNHCIVSDLFIGSLNKNYPDFSARYSKIAPDSITEKSSDTEGSKNCRDLGI